MTEFETGSPITARKAKEINIKEIFGIFKRKIWFIALITITITIIGTLYSRFTTEHMYESSTRVIISANANEVDLSTLMVMVKDPEVMEKVINQLNLHRSAETLASQISVSNIGDSQVVLISVVDDNPKTAAAIANSTATIYKDEMLRILNFDDIELLKEATPNPYPINNNGMRSIILSILVGLVISVGAVLILNTMDDTIKSEEDIEKEFGIPVVGKIPVISKKELKITRQTVQIEVIRGDTVGT
jgi:capsular polysaccharide biosynthesis protein